ncbi:MAG: hypothetical protein EB168_02485 [Euryarchaeota archaeon]|jgi:hypothetical protein|nr:hypothetical protein [Euryarchaeota archaeon]
MAELNTAYELWNTLKDELKDPKESATDVINCLIDNLGFTHADIKESDFIKDPDFKSVLVDLEILEDTAGEGLDEWGDEQEDDNYWRQDDEGY